MKLATFTANGRERFGIVLEHPATGEAWLFDPGVAQARLKLYASKQTSPLVNRQPHFLDAWPEDLTAFLELGHDGMEAARRLHDTLVRFLQLDQALLTDAGFPLASVRLRAPVPRPRLFFGLVQNSPTFVRNDPGRLTANVYPQGHQRPQGSLLGPDDPVYVTAEMHGFSWTPEPAVVIGRGGRNIAATEAHRHIAGYTLVMDLVHDRYLEQIREAAGGPLDWFEEATGSWLGKKSDAMGAMGPFLTTSDEVLNPYDLLLTTRQSGLVRDRAHTGAMLIGVERLVAWLSSFMTLHPGDVLHMGTMAYDGMLVTDAMTFGPDDTIEGELEQVGTLRLPVVMAAREDWRDADDPGRRIHPVPAVRDLIEAGRVACEAGEWAPGSARHFWTVFGNYRAAGEVEGLVARALPRVLNAPASALAPTGSRVRVPERARTLSLGVELAFVIGRLTYRVTAADAVACILGYTPLLALHDSSFADALSFPATPQEANLPTFYARWADGFNVVSPSPRALAPPALRGRAMRLSAPGLGSLRSSTDEYLLLAPEVLAFLSQEITLFPGDVVTLGRTEERLILPAEHPLAGGFTARAVVEGVGEVEAHVGREAT